VKLVSELLEESEKFFAEVEAACEALSEAAPAGRGGGDGPDAGASGRNGAFGARTWCRIR
jgi:hypothetical protein